MTNKKRKGFTIVELVIVIAVIAILAGVLIPTFASIIDKANQSSDIQAVRQMNVLLKAESVEDKPTDVNKVIEIVSKAGYDTVEKRTPKSKDHGFYWHSGTNLIVLVKDKTELVYPNDNETLNELFEDEGFTVEDEEEFKNLATDAGSGEGGDESEVKSAGELQEALEAGKSVKLGNDITITTINEAIEISNGITSTLDLNGNTLTLGNGVVGDDVITVNGSLTFKNGNVVISRPSDVESIYFYSGISVGDDGVAEGTLNFDKVTVTADRLWNIVNYANLSFTNSKLVVTGGYGIDNDGEAVIENCELVANGEGTTQVYGEGGTMSISNTKLYEGTGEGTGEYTDFESYYYSSPIEAHDGCVITLGSGTTVTTSEQKDDEGIDLIYSAQVGNGGKIIVNGATIGYKILCVGDSSSITIYGGTVNGVEFADITVDSNIFAGAGFGLTEGSDVNGDYWLISISE